MQEHPNDWSYRQIVDGARISVEFTMILVRSPDGERTGCAAIIRDVTARWQKEQELKSKEEELLFPALEAIGVRRDGGPIGVMLMEHQQGREFVRKMKEAFSEHRSGNPAAAVPFTREARGYITLLDQHILKENNVLFPLAKNQLSESKQSELAKGFEAIELQKIGVGKHEEFHKMLDNLERVYLK